MLPRCHITEADRETHPSLFLPDVCDCDPGGDLFGKRERRNCPARPPNGQTATDCRELAVSFLGGFLWQEGTSALFLYPLPREFLIQTHLELGLKNAIHSVHRTWHLPRCRNLSSANKRGADVMTMSGAIQAVAVVVAIIVRPDSKHGRCRHAGTAVKSRDCVGAGKCGHYIRASLRVFSLTDEWGSAVNRRTDHVL